MVVHKRQRLPVHRPLDRLPGNLVLRPEVKFPLLVHPLAHLHYDHLVALPNRLSHLLGLASQGRRLWAGVSLNHLLLAVVLANPLGVPGLPVAPQVVLVDRVCPDVPVVVGLMTPIHLLSVQIQKGI